MFHVKHAAGGQTAPFGFARAAAAGLTFRPIADADLPFLARLYASTRAEELVPVPWTEEAKAAFLLMQFQAQHDHYQTHYTGADWLLVELAAEPVGRLYIARWAREHRLIDIALLPKFCGRGLGTALLRDLMDEALAAGKALTIHVEKNNPAMRLYRRLGFVPVGEHGVYDLMRWTQDRKL
jgi:ribosomal protein S18 acetylase RimI-like enzyme